MVAFIWNLALLTLAVPALAIPTGFDTHSPTVNLNKRVIYDGKNAQCPAPGYQYYSKAAVEAAAQEAANHLFAGTTVGTGNYPKTFGNREAFVYPNCSPPYKEFPIMSSGQIFAGKNNKKPGADRVVIGNRAGNSANLCDQFFASIELTIGSLELKFTVRYFGWRLNRVLDRCLEYCVPGKLTQLTLKFQSDRDHLPNGPDDRFLRPNDWKTVGNDASQRVSWPVSLPNSRLDDILAPVTVLKLDKLFPYWTSKAYHGLVELHLVSWELAKNSIQITEHQLGEIFRSSPALKILYFGIEITPAPAPYPPVQLEDLEELQLRADSIQSQQIILRLLIPGSKPMQMYIEYEPPQEDEKLPSSTEDELQRFLGRSNITQLFLDSHSLHLDMPAFIQLVPNVEILILRYLRLDATNPATVPYMYGAPNYPKLHTIHFRFGRVQLDAFRWISDKRNLGLQRVTMAHSVIGVGERVKPYQLEQYTDILQGIFPGLELINWPEEEFLFEDREELAEVRYSG